MDTRKHKFSGIERVELVNIKKLELSGKGVRMSAEGSIGNCTYNTCLD